MALSAERKAEIVKEYQQSEGDTGSPGEQDGLSSLWDSQNRQNSLGATGRPADQRVFFAYFLQ